METKYVVRYYDTDYGFVTESEFKSRKVAEMFVRSLIFDYGEECQATIIEREDTSESEN